MHATAKEAGAFGSGLPYDVHELLASAKGGDSEAARSFARALIASGRQDHVALAIQHADQSPIPGTVEIVADALRDAAENVEFERGRAMVGSLFSIPVALPRMVPLDARRVGHALRECGLVGGLARTVVVSRWLPSSAMTGLDHCGVRWMAEALVRASDTVADGGCADVPADDVFHAIASDNGRPDERVWLIVGLTAMPVSEIRRDERAAERDITDGRISPADMDALLGQAPLHADDNEDGFGGDGQGWARALEYAVEMRRETGRYTYDFVNAPMTGLAMDRFRAMAEKLFCLGANVLDVAPFLDGVRAAVSTDAHR